MTQPIIRLSTQNESARRTQGEDANGSPLGETPIVKEPAASQGVNLKPNIDPSEVEKFSSVAAHWWELEGDLKTLHQINPLRLQFITSKASLLNQSVIDIGCGGGILTEGMAKLGAKVTGIDMSKPALDVAKLHQLETGLSIDYIHSTAEEIAAERPGQYDVVTCMELLEHVPDPYSILKASSQLVKPNGHIFLSTINRNLKSYLFAIVGAEYLLRLLPKQTHDYAKFIKPSELANWGRKVNLSIEDLTGIHYNLLTQAFSLEKDVSVNYLVHMRPHC